MHYKINEPVKTDKPNTVLLVLAVSGWTVLLLFLVACWVMDNLGGKLW